MQGRLFTLFEIPFPSYFVLLLTGFLFATIAGALWAKRVGQDIRPRPRKPMTAAIGAMSCAMSCKSANNC